jgi:hypothetical protein
MTKKIVAVLALSLVSSSAFASQAKNIISGGGDGGNILGVGGMNGSFYTNDEYNMFYNPAFINGMKKWAIVENGSTSGVSGGFVTEAGAFNLGVFLNRSGLTAGRGAQPIDIVLGGDMGVKWGVGLTHTLSEGGPATTRLKAGAMVADFEPFVHYTLKNTNGAASETKDSGMTVGTRYHWGDWTPYAAYTTTKATTAGTEAANSASTWGLGMGRNAKFGDVTMDYAISYWNGKTAADVKSQSVPVNMNFSAKAASWFTARAGFAHNLITRGAAAAGTATTLGGSFHMGNADMDMVVGNTADVSAVDANSFGFSACKSDPSFDKPGLGPA